MASPAPAHSISTPYSALRRAFAPTLYKQVDLDQQSFKWDRIALQHGTRAYTLAAYAHTAYFANSASGTVYDSPLSVSVKR